MEKFPDPKQYLECHSYQDENGEKWKIARIANGFFVAYFGRSYFKEETFEVVRNGKFLLIKNTGCFFIQDMNFDTFYEFRNILKKGWTDDIWELLAERLANDPGLMECEIIQ